LGARVDRSFARGINVGITEQNNLFYGRSHVMKKFNWQIWAGFLLTLFAFLSYPFIFIDYPILRDFPWLNLLLFALALVLLFIGLRRAFKPGRRLISKILAPVLATLSVLVIALFIFSVLIEARRLPASAGAPQVGQKMPEFTLTDTNNQLVSLSQILSQPLQPSGEVASAKSEKPKGVLLIFFRGYW